MSSLMDFNNLRQLLSFSKFTHLIASEILATSDHSLNFLALPNSSRNSVSILFLALIGLFWNEIFVTTISLPKFFLYVP